MSVRVPPGITLFEAATWAGVTVDSTCGARGTCKKCRVRLTAGELEPTEADRRALEPAELAEGWRLACRSTLGDGPAGTLEVEVPPLLGAPKAALLGHGRHVVLAPAVQKRHLTLPPPTLDDQAPDLDRLERELSDLEPTVSLSVLRALPRTLRDSDFDVTAVVVGDRLVAVEPLDTSAESFGLALDIGTTTIVGTLIGLRGGTTEALASRLNGQERFGADVITRIAYAGETPSRLAELRSTVLATIDELIEELYLEAKVDPSRVYHAVAVGNPTMLHLLLGVDPAPLAVAPFTPGFRDALDLSGAEVGLRMHPEGRVHTLPLVGAYVGADAVAGVLATGLGREDKLSLLIDIGTNGEIVLGTADRVLAAAAPAGPAFEGAEIHRGMRASPGAIESVSFDGDTVALEVVGGVEPRGICGSGLADAVAQLLAAGLLEPSGRLLRREQAAGHPLAERLFELDGASAFRLADGVELTQRDVRELQFAKGATAAGTRILLDTLGVRADELDEVLLAGSFGTFVDPVSASAIGLTPAIDVDRISSVGNSAIAGAKMALLSFREQRLAAELAERIEYVELSGLPDFDEVFVEALAFPDPARAA